jgi:NADH:ubiquinone oxidoreductase subunit
LTEGYRRQVKKRFRGLSASKNEDVTRTSLDPAIYLPLTVLGTRLIAEIRWFAATVDGAGWPNLTGQFGLPMASRPQAFLNRPGPMKQFLLKLFTWWNGQTFGTQLWTWRFGELVGEDEQGNRYFRTRGGKIDPSLGFERRWVIYNGYAEASRVPPSWHGWLHHTVDLPPTEEAYEPHEWEKPHLPNMTGTPLAYRPPGSTLASGRRPKATGDYQPWTPGN